MRILQSLDMSSICCWLFVPILSQDWSWKWGIGKRKVNSTHEYINFCWGCISSTKQHPYWSFQGDRWKFLWLSCNQGERCQSCPTQTGQTPYHPFYNYIAILVVDIVHRQAIDKQPNKNIQCVDLEVVIVHMDVLFALVRDTTTCHVQTQGIVFMKLGMSGMEWTGLLDRPKPVSGAAGLTSKATADVIKKSTRQMITHNQSTFKQRKGY